MAASESESLVTAAARLGSAGMLRDPNHKDDWPDQSPQILSVKRNILAAEWGRPYGRGNGRSVR